MVGRSRANVFEWIEGTEEKTAYILPMPAGEGNGLPKLAQSCMHQTRLSPSRHNAELAPGVSLGRASFDPRLESRLLRKIFQLNFGRWKQRKGHKARRRREFSPKTAAVRS